MVYVDVAINLPVKNLFRQFTYAVPADLDFLDCGWRVVVPFHGRTVEGFVLQRIEPPATGLEKIKMIEAALGREPWFDEAMLATAKWLANYYMCSLAEAMRLFIPGKSSIKRKVLRDADGKKLLDGYAERLKERYVLAYKFSSPESTVLSEFHRLFPRAQAKIRALEFFAQNQDKWLSINELDKKNISRSTVKLLADKGYLLEGKVRVLRDSYRSGANPGLKLKLTDEQSEAVRQITAAVTAKQGDTFLLQGVTGSGKTEVYLRCAAQAIEQGLQVMLLVPEIALTAQLVQRFQAWFGDRIAVAHSKLSANERGDVCYRMRNHQADILIGVRSAVFAPFAALGLVIIDEEHESSYKQEERPNYHAREVAATRCRLSGATLVLGSATPDIISYYAALQGRYRHLRLSERPNGSALPQAEIVDMRAELQARNFNVLSRRLGNLLVTTASAGEQAIVLLNRRGYSTSVICRDCGTSIICPHCSVALVYHSAQEALRCHYCGNTAPIPQTCPNCGSRRIRYLGTGTQKAERELAGIPSLKVLRMDQDSTGPKFAHMEILQKFSAGAYNTLVGTQMVAKGHDIPNVTLVGVLNADAALNLPDYRAGERAFSLLTQAAGRAGRGSKPGLVVFQSYAADNPVLQLAARQDYDRFAVRELAERRKYSYPPFAELLKITVLDKDEKAGQNLAKKLVLFLESLQLAGDLPQSVTISGPFPALVAKVRELYRFNVIIKAEDLSAVKAVLFNSVYKDLKNVYFDVDPVNVL